MRFQLISDFKPTGDQPQAIEKLVKGIKESRKHQVLLGVTGSGKTFTMAKVIEKVQKPTLVISHNKTLAGQVYQEFRDFFPNNAVSYFVSYYDYYQPESYIPQTDTYIEKETEINEEIDKLRLQGTTNLMTRSDAIIVASVSCIYNLGSPKEYGNYIIKLKIQNSPLRPHFAEASRGFAGQAKYKINRIIDDLTRLQYERDDYDFRRGTFRLRGDTLFVWPAYQDEALKIQFLGDRIEKMSWVHPLTGKQCDNEAMKQCNSIVIYPAKHYMTNPDIYEDAFTQIRKDLKKRVKELKNQGKILEAHRLESRTEYDLEMISELGYVNGIENYSRYFDGRAPGEPPYTLLDYFRQAGSFLTIIDESHITIPQLQGMYRGDLSRKKALIEYGFRLPSCLDNRPLKFEEFLPRTDQIIYTSATPDEREINQARKSGGGVVEQLIRPTGLPDPAIEIRKTKGQVENLAKEIIKRKQKGERVLVTTLTKRLAEALAEHLNKVKSRSVAKAMERRRQKSKVKSDELSVCYLHSEIETLDRSDILDDLRAGKYDCLVGINLLREGLDLPEVSLVAILDADKEGFLRSKTSLIQTMGRAARHVSGKVIMYADEVTGSMREAIAEVERRRKVQLLWNKKYGIKPKSIKKPIRDKLIRRSTPNHSCLQNGLQPVIAGTSGSGQGKIDLTQLTPEDRQKYLKNLRRAMHKAARELNFELAAEIRDEIKELESEL